MVAGNGFDCLVFLIELVNHLWITNDDAAGVEVVVECLTLAQEFGREEQAELVCGVPAHLFELLGILYIQATAVTYGNGTLDNHCCLWVHFKNKVYYILNVVGVEEVLLWVVVGRCCNDNEIGIAVCLATVECGTQVQFLFCEVFLYIIVLYGRYAIVDFFNFFRNYIHCDNFVVLCQQSGNT